MLRPPSPIYPASIQVISTRHQPEKEFVKHFHVEDIDIILLRSLQDVGKVTPSKEKAIFTDFFFDQDLAENFYIWIKKRVYEHPQHDPEWSVKFVQQYHQRNKPLEFFSYTGEDLEAIVKTIMKDKPYLLPGSVDLRAIDDSDLFLTIYTERISVQHISEGHTQGSTCWIDASRDRDGSEYFVSCGMRYTNEAEATQLFQTEFKCKLPKDLIFAPSKALVFSNIHQLEIAADQSRVMDAAKHMRSFNPLDQELVLLSNQVDVWAKAWWEKLAQSSSSVPDTPERNSIRDYFFLFAKRLNGTPAEDLLRFSPAELCQQMLSNSQFSYADLTHSEKLALTGVCGLLRVWRCPYNLDCSMQELLSKPDDQLRNFLHALTTDDMYVLRNALPPLAKESKSESEHAAAQHILRYIDDNFDLQDSLRKYTVDFQLAAFGDCEYTFPL